MQPCHVQHERGTSILEVATLLVVHSMRSTPSRTRQSLVSEPFGSTEGWCLLLLSSTKRKCLLCCFIENRLLLSNVDSSSSSSQSSSSSKKSSSFFFSIGCCFCFFNRRIVLFSSTCEALDEICLFPETGSPCSLRKSLSSATVIFS